MVRSSLDKTLRCEVRETVAGFLLDRSTTDHIIERIMANNPRKTSSFQAQVLDLEPGESCSKVRAVPTDITVGDLPEQLQVLRQQLRNTISPAVKRATEQTGAGYTVEVTDALMPGGTLYTVAVVTRKPD